MKAYAQLLGEGARTDAALLAVVAAYLAYASLVSMIFGLPAMTPPFFLASGYLNVSVLVLMASVYFLYRLLRERPDSPFAFVRQVAREHDVSSRVSRAAPAFVALVVFGPTFSRMKAVIPFVEGFRFDPVFRKADHLLLGDDAWRVLQPLIGHPLITWAINWSYHGWVGVMMIITLIAVFWIEQPRLRAQYLLAYFGCWILLGTVAATLLSSVGPCFYETFYGDAYYAPLMAYLNHANSVFHLPALDVQASLVSWHRTGDDGLGRGISAMPSMHISMATLFALFGWRVSRAWGIALTLFLALIFVGSVHLGYHYAVDGIVAFLGTLAIWALAGWAAARPVLAAKPRPA